MFNLKDFQNIDPLMEKINTSYEADFENLIQDISKIKIPLLMSKYEKEVQKKWDLSKQEFNNFKKQYLNKTPTDYAKELIKLLIQEKIAISYNRDNDCLYFFEKYWKRIENEKTLKAKIREILPAHKESEHYINEVFNAVIALAISESKLLYPNEEKDKLYVNNGVLDINTLELKDHNQFNYNKYVLPVDYNPAVEYPNWSKALKQWVNSDETINFLQEYIGYCFYTENKFQKALILLGSGSNGKSTFLEIVSKLIGESNISNLPLQRLGGRFDSAYLQDKLINIAGDLDPTYMTETGIVKEIISGGTIIGEIKGGKTFSFKANCKLLFSCNELPHSRDKSDGWYRRFFIVDFPNKFTPDSPEYDPELNSKLISELPGIQNWAIEGLKRLLTNKKFTVSSDMKFELNKYRADNDNVAYFFQNFHTKTPDYDQVISEAYDIYLSYCEDYKTTALERNKFTSRLKSLGINNFSTTRVDRSVRVFSKSTFKYTASQ